MPGSSGGRENGTSGGDIGGVNMSGVNSVTGGNRLLGEVLLLGELVTTKV